MAWSIAAFAAALALLASAPDAALAAPADPAAACEVKKLKGSAVYAACRLKAEAKARRSGGEPDFAKCEERFATTFGKAEEKAGPGVCASDGDTAPIADEIDAATQEVAEQLAGPDPACPPGLWDRDEKQTVLAAIAAWEAGDEAALACNYHPDAFMIDDQGVLIGPAEITAALFSLRDLLGPVTHDIHETNIFNEIVRVLYTLDAGWVVIEDGTDTYVVERGRIRRQTRHGTIRFTGPPPD